MTLYLDLIFIINFAFDLLLLLVVDITLKRRASFKKILLGAIVGALSIFFLFIKISNLTLFFLKLIISILMLLISFSYKSFKYFINNFLYLYTSSILLGGFLYYLNITFSYKQEGLVFFFNKISINYVVLLIMAPIILYIYTKQNKKLKNKYNNYYEIKIILLNNKVLIFNVFLDTGHKLRDPINNKNILLIEKKLLAENDIFLPILIPYKVLNHNGLLPCIRIKEAIIKGFGKTNKILLGLSEDEFNIDGVNGIISNEIMEEMKWLKNLFVGYY